MPAFAHLSVRSSFSLKEGAIAPEVLPHAARAHGMDRVAITDRDSLAGAVRFTKACRETGVAPVYGVRLTIARDEIAAEAGERFMLTLLARNQIGYGNLCRTITAAHSRGERGDPCATLDDLRKHRDGLVVMAGRGSEVVSLIEQRRDDDARTALRTLLELLGHRDLRLAVSHLGEAGDDSLIKRQLAFAEEHGITPVATNEVRMLARADVFVCDVLDSMRKLVPLSRHHRNSNTAEAWLKPAEEMAKVFDERPSLLASAYELAASCKASIGLGDVRVPNYPPTGRPLTRNEANSELARRCHEGLRRRGMAMTDRVRRTLDAELAMCARLGFSPYFLAVCDLVAMIKEMGISCACRGSAAGSLICYALSISDVDPIEYDLVFERFMNLHRTNELPDIDLDVESARREDVYRAIISRFPSGLAGCLTMIDTYKARGAIREVGKALGLPDGELGVVAKSFPHVRAAGIGKALEKLPELRGVERDRLAMLFDVCERLDGAPRHLALHPSGVLISPANLADIAPLERSAHGFPMAQLDKHDVEDLGLLKLDVLGVRMFSALAYGVAEIKRTTKEEVDLGAIDTEDPKTFELIRASRTLGCFQIESPGQRELLQKLQPTRWKDLILEISLFRPGPVRSDMINPYLMRRAGFQKPFYAHAELRKFLGESFGIVVYHEQVMLAITAVTGIDLGLADLVRRKLGEKDLLPRIRTWFFERGKANGWRDEEMESIWTEVSSFAAFGFCKAHAAAFAVPTYRSAWMKAHHPAAFFAGVLTHDPGMYPRRALLDDARHEGVTILGLDINKSQRTYTVEKIGKELGIRIALMDVERISDEEIDSVLAARKERLFDGLVDFARRTRVKRPVVESLIHAGAFDEFGNRRDLLLAIGELWEKRFAKPEPSQGELMRSEPVVEWGLREYSDAEKVRAELEVLGLDVSRHLISFYAPALQKLNAMTAPDLKRCKSGQRVLVAGVKIASQTPQIRSGQRIIFLTLDDGHGLVDVTIFESVQDRCAEPAFHCWLQLVRGTVHRTGRAGVSLNAERIWDLGAITRSLAEGTLDLDELWNEGVEEIERVERERLAARRGAPRPREETVVEELRKPTRLPTSRNAPAAAPSAAPPRKLWHRSPGSAG